MNVGDTLKSRLYAKTEQDGDCIVWTGAQYNNGYGHIGNNAGTKWHAVPVHRAAWAVEHGSFPDGMHVDHICHNKLCVNIEHLRLATNKQNGENRRGAQSNSESGIRGVRFEKRTRRWAACVVHNKKILHLGRFDSAEEATAAVVAKRNDLFTHNDADRVAQAH